MGIRFAGMELCIATTPFTANKATSDQKVREPSINVNLFIILYFY